jgi:hypothetical protein
MCASCFSSADGLLLGSAGALAALREARQWLRARHTTTRAERKAERLAADAEFLRGLGLDPDEVLGRIPSPAPAPAPAPSPPPVPRERVLVGS